MKMMMLELTNKEYQAIQRSLRITNDMDNDMALESFTTNLWIRTDETITLTEESAKVLRDEIDTKLNDAVVRVNLLNKFHIKVNNIGYTISE